MLICCYDIENSIIYAVGNKVDGSYEVNQHIMKLLEQEVTHTSRGYFNKKEADIIRPIVDDINKESGAEMGSCEYLELIAMTEKYLSNFYIKDTVTGEIQDNLFARTPQDDNDIFEEYLVKPWLKGSDVLFTAHNIDYEYSYIRYNTNFLQRLTKACTTYNIIPDNINTPKMIEFIKGEGKKKKKGAKFIFMDTYLMTNKKIATLGKSFNLPKLDYDYDVIRTASSPLTQLDYDYNRRDNEIAMKAIEQLLKQIEQNSGIYDPNAIPSLSATAHNKKLCKINPNINDYSTVSIGLTMEQVHKNWSQWYNMPNLESYKIFFNASGGGTVFVNPEFTGKIISNLKSFDIRSAHPSQFYNKYFPAGKTMEQIHPKDYQATINQIKKMTEDLMRDPIAYYNSPTPIQSDCVLIVSFKGLRPRKLPNNNHIYTLGNGYVSNGKRECIIDNLDRCAYNINPTSVNGKTITSEHYIKTFYGQDLVYHLSFYEYDEIEIIDGYTYKLVPCDEYIINKSDYFGEKKTVYKNFVKYTKQHNYQETYDYMVANNAEPYTLASCPTEDKARLHFLEEELLRIKGLFNGLFGMEYQNIIHGSCQFGEDWSLIEGAPEKSYEKTIGKTTTHYTVGAYTAMWSRVELACMIWHAINSGATICYGATDSVKLLNADKDIYKDFYIGHNGKWSYRNKYDLGTVEYEEEYKLAYIPETLKLVGVNDDKDGNLDIHFTLSGFKASVYFKDLLEEYGQVDTHKHNKKPYTDAIGMKCMQTVEKMLQPQIIPAEKSGKTIRNRKFAGMITPTGQINFGAIEPAPYTLLGSKITERSKTS